MSHQNKLPLQKTRKKETWCDSTFGQVTPVAAGIIPYVIPLSLISMMTCILSQCWCNIMLCDRLSLSLIENSCMQCWHMGCSNANLIFLCMGLTQVWRGTVLLAGHVFHPQLFSARSAGLCLLGIHIKILKSSSSLIVDLLPKSWQCRWQIPSHHHARTT